MASFFLDEQEGASRLMDAASAEPRPPSFGDQFLYGARRQLDIIPSMGVGLAEGIIGPAMSRAADLGDSLDQNDDFEPFWNGLRERAEEGMQAARTFRRTDLAPDPVLSTQASETLFGLGEMFGLGAIGATAGGGIGAGFTLGTTYANRSYADFLDEGVDEQTASGAALIEGGSLALMAGVPVSLPGMLATRMASGAAFNVGMGAGQRASLESYLRSNGYEEQAQRYRWNDSTALITDAVLGAAFGGVFGQAARAARRQGGPRAPDEGAAPDPLAPMRDGTYEPSPEVIDAALTLETERRARVDSAPGIPLDLEAEAKHAETMARVERQAIEGEPIDAGAWSEEDAVRFAPFPPEYGTLERFEQAIRDIEAELGNLGDDIRDRQAMEARARAQGYELGDGDVLFSRRAERATDADAWRSIIGTHPWINSPSRAMAVFLARQRKADGTGVYTSEQIAEQTGYANRKTVDVLLKNARDQGVDLSIRVTNAGRSLAEGIVSALESGLRNGQVLTGKQIAQRLGTTHTSVRTTLSHLRSGKLTAVAPDLRERLRAANERMNEIRKREGRQIYPLASRGDTFYSAVERAVETSRTARASGAQWWATISKAAGVKKEELEWIGLEDFLKAQEGPISREDVLAFVRANGVQVEETVLRGDGATDPELQRQLLPLIEERDRRARRFDELTAQMSEAEKAMRPGDPNASETVRERWAIEADWNDLHDKIYALEQQDQRSAGAARWASYTLPGGENYREVLLRLPTKTLDALQAEHQRLQQEFEALDDRSGPEARAIIARLKEIDAASAQASSAQFRSSHWDQPNVLAHVRFNERTDANGKRTLFVEEVQSDWHQLGRKKGYQGEELTPEEIELRALNGKSYERNALTDADKARMEELKAKGVSASLQAKLSGVPNAPFKNNAWAALAMKRMIRWAAENGFEQVAWIPGRIQNGREHGEGDNRGAFYDRILPNIANDLGKKYGARTGETRIVADKEGWHITPPDQTVAGRWMVKSSDYNSKGLHFDTEAEARAALDEKLNRETVHAFPITPELRDAAMEGLPLFSMSAQRGFSTIDSLRAHLAEEFGADWVALERAGIVEIVQSTKDLPVDRSVDLRGVKGVHMPKEGRTYFVADNVRPGEAKALLLHEIGVHHGLPKMLGERGFRAVIRQVDMLVKNEHPLALEARQAAEMGAFDKKDIPEETLAYLIEFAPDLPITKRILATIRQWLVKTFGSTFGLRLTVEDIRALALSAVRKTAADARRNVGPVNLGDEIRAMRDAVDEMEAEDEALLASAQREGYQGNDTGEAREWLEAKAKGLDMSPEARMARAEEQGFVRSFHGTNRDVRGAFRRSGSGALGPGVYHGRKPSTTDVFAGTPRAIDRDGVVQVEFGAGSNVMPIMTRGRMATVAQLDAAIEKASRELRADPFAYETQDRAIEDLKRQGFDGVSDPARDFHNTFDPRNIRSIFAAFDPAKRDSSDLLASAGPVPKRINLPAPFVGAADVLANPRSRDILQMLSDQRRMGVDESVRWGLTEDGELLIWDGNQATHGGVEESAGSPFKATGEINDPLEVQPLFRWLAREKRQAVQAYPIDLLWEGDNVGYDGEYGAWDVDAPSLRARDIKGAARQAPERRAYSEDARGTDWTPQDHARRIATLMKEGWNDPIVVRRIGDKEPVRNEDGSVDYAPQIVDGKHRLAAARMMGRKTIDVIWEGEEGRSQADAYSKLDPVEQALADDPNMKLRTQEGEALAREVLAIADENAKRAAEMGKGFDAAMKCAIRHGGALTAQAGRRAARDIVVGQGIGLAAAIPVGYGVAMGARAAANFEASPRNIFDRRRDALEQDMPLGADGYIDAPVVEPPAQPEGPRRVAWSEPQAPSEGYAGRAQTSAGEAKVPPAPASFRSDKDQ